MFGRSQMPVGPFRLQMAYPPSGCDPSAYTGERYSYSLPFRLVASHRFYSLPAVRVRGTVVAVLRGGGCSFGIKVINAQKLGAIAVIIVNTEDQKNMRIMASSDEAPLISIPCVMVSNRFQQYMNDRLIKYHLYNQHFLSFDPTGLFNKYDDKKADRSLQ